MRPFSSCRRHFQIRNPRPTMPLALPAFFPRSPHCFIKVYILFESNFRPLFNRACIFSFCSSIHLLFVFSCFLTFGTTYISSKLCPLVPLSFVSYNIALLTHLSFYTVSDASILSFVTFFYFYVSITCSTLTTNNKWSFLIILLNTLSKIELEVISEYPHNPCTYR